MKSLSVRKTFASFALVLLSSANSFAHNVDDQGVHLGSMSQFRHLVPAGTLENTAAKYFAEQTDKARKEGKLLPADDPTAKRVNAIAQKLIPHAIALNPRAKDWKWEINVVRTGTINANCLAGGKITVFTGLIEKLKMTDSEIAFVLGHEIGHAVREHIRGQLGKKTTMGLATVAAGAKYGVKGAVVAGGASQLLGKKFSRNDESESDIIGVDLAARAGYSPRGALSTLLKFQKAMPTTTRDEFLSTHPANATRVDHLIAHLKQHAPTYKKIIAKANDEKDESLLASTDRVVESSAKIRTSLQ